MALWTYSPLRVSSSINPITSIHAAIYNLLGIKSECVVPPVDQISLAHPEYWLSV